MTRNAKHPYTAPAMTRLPSASGSSDPEAGIDPRADEFTRGYVTALRDHGIEEWKREVDSSDPEAVGLDVERLARAITLHRTSVYASDGADSYLGHSCMGDCAEDILAALTEAKPETPA